MTETTADATPASPVLVVEDEEIVRELLRDILSEEGYAIDAVASGEDALRALDARLYDIVLLDLHLPGIHGLEVLAKGPSLQTDARFIVMTAYESIDSALEAMKLGAFDYLRKPFRTEEFLLVLSRAREELALRREVLALRSRSPDARSGIVGHSKALNRMFTLVERVAPTRANALITGETGTGKELVARAIHQLSGRAQRPFVAVNCSAVPETLLESELFGHMKGSFTGAIQNRRGLFEEAAGGTLLLDEISTIPSSVQAKLLRVLQDRKVLRVGARKPVTVDFRLIAITNIELHEAVERGEFREDLYYRLNVFPIMVPPLRERRDDIPLLAQYFRRRFAKLHGVEAPGISARTLERMTAYDWPGNVRELENLMERAVIMYAGSDSIPFQPPQSEDSGDDQLARFRSDDWTLEKLERAAILDALRRSQWRREVAAQRLGISRRTLYRKLQRYREEGLLQSETALPERTAADAARASADPT